jgi:hypothetical protein
MKDDPFDWWMPERGDPTDPGAGPRESDTKPGRRLAALQRLNCPDEPVLATLCHTAVQVGYVRFVDPPAFFWRRQKWVNTPHRGWIDEKLHFGSEDCLFMGYGLATTLPPPCQVDSCLLKPCDCS